MPNELTNWMPAERWDALQDEANSLAALTDFLAAESRGGRGWLARIFGGPEVQHDHRMLERYQELLLDITTPFDPSTHSSSQIDAEIRELWPLYVAGYERTPATAEALGTDKDLMVAIKDAVRSAQRPAADIAGIRYYHTALKIEALQRVRRARIEQYVEEAEQRGASSLPDQVARLRRHLEHIPNNAGVRIQGTNRELFVPDLCDEERAFTQDLIDRLESRSRLLGGDVALDATPLELLQSRLDKERIQRQRVLEGAQPASRSKMPKTPKQRADALDRREQSIRKAYEQKIAQREAAGDVQGAGRFRKQMQLELDRLAESDP